MKLPDFAVKQPITILMLFMAFIIIGIISLTKLNIDMFPEIEPPVISILTTWPGASASDIASEVTEIIEDRMNDVSNLDTLASKSLDNLSVVSCKFDWGTDLDNAANDIRDRLELAKRELPRDVETPMIFKFSSSMAPILFFTIAGDKTWPRLYHLTDKMIADELKRVPGVGAMEIYGGLRRRINVYFDLKKIEGFRLSIPQINRILAAENLNLPSGTIDTGSKEYFVRVPGKYKSIDELKGTIIGFYQKRPVYLYDVAEVEDAFKPQDINGWGDGEKALVVILKKQAGTNTINVINGIKAKLKKIQDDLPSDVRINIVSDSSEDILKSVKNLRRTLFWGIVFIILVTLVFLRRLRTALIISLTIPFSLIISFILLFLSGYTINLVSLLSLAIASGIVVDNGIVVLENIFRHIEEGGKVKSSSIFGASEMGMAITASTMTTVIVFLPLMFLTGLPGIIFKQMGFVIVATLLASLFTALTITPMLCSKWIKATPDVLRKREGIIGTYYNRSEAFFEMLDDGYSRLLKWSLNHKAVIIILSLAIFLSSLSFLPFLSTGFMPKVDSGNVSVNFRLPEGTRIEETNKVIDAILKEAETIIDQEKFIHSYGFDGKTEKGIGVALGFDEGPNVGKIGFKYVDRDKRRQSAEDIAAKLREKVAKIPGITNVNVSAQDVIASILMGGGKAISVQVQGADRAEIYSFAKKLESSFKSIPGLVDVAINQKDPRPEIWVDIDRQKASSLGLNVAIIATTLRNYFYGNEATKFRDAGEDFEVFTRLTEHDKNSIDTLLNIPVFAPDGTMIRLGNIATLKDGTGPIEIERKNRSNIIKVEGSLYKRALGAVNNDIHSILKKIEIPEGVSVGFGGDIEEQGKAFKDLLILLILGIILVYMIMAALFENLRDPLIIMFSVPFAFSGVFYILFLTGTSIGIMSFMGLIMLMGIVVNNAIVLVDYIHLLQKRGAPLLEAIINAGKNRLRPVLMTTATTFFGMLPMAVSKSVGAEVWNPIGLTILGGLSVSSLVTLILIPVIYYMFENRKQRINQ